MSFIADTIQSINSKNRKALSVFLTAGFPRKENFVELARSVYDRGADLLEIGIPFSDPLADGPVIQHSSQVALANGINLRTVLQMAEAIKMLAAKPLILMGYSNPIIHYGFERFAADAANAGVDGLIIPDVPLEEYDDFFGQAGNGIDRILLTTPTSPKERIVEIDRRSSGFVYCVSVTGTTGERNNFDERTLTNLQRTYHTLQKNKMLIGFGISSPQDVKRFAPFCDGMIVGSAVIKRLMNSREDALQLIGALRKACDEE